MVEAVARAIHTEAREQNIVSRELAPPLTDDTESDNPQPLHHYVDRHASKIIDRGRDHIFSAFDTGRTSNAKHSDIAVWEFQTKMSLMGRADSRSAYRTMNRKQENALHNDTHVRAVKKLATPKTYQYSLADFFTPDQSAIPSPNRIAETIQDPFHEGTSWLLSSIRGTEGFQGPVIAAIDYTVVPFHSSPWKSPEDIELDDERIVMNEKTGKTKVPKENHQLLIEPV